MVDSAVARAILRTLAQDWPEQANLEGVRMEERGRWIIVTVRTSTPGPVVGQRGSTASEIKERLRAAVPDKTVVFRVHPDSPGVPTE